MKNRKELIENSKIYFNNKDVNLIYATTDGQFFHEKSKQDLDNYIRSNHGVLYETIHKNDLNSVKIEIEKPIKKIEKPKGVKKEVNNKKNKK